MGLKDHLFYRCLTSIYYIIGPVKELHIEPATMHQSHLKKFFYNGVQPNYFSTLWPDSEENFETIPIERLFYFLQSVKKHGPTLTEMSDYIMEMHK
jgi:hypothetical protein